MRHLGFLLLACAGLLTACSQVVDETDLSPAGVNHTSSDVYWFADETQVEGAWARLTTNPQGGTLNVNTNGLPAGDAFTLWWVIFNDPEECSDPGCGEDDIFVDGDPAKGFDMAQINATGLSVVFGTGHVIGDNGKASFATHLQAGEITGDREVVIGPEDGPAGLLEPMTAEVHAVVRTHGPPIPGHVAEQIGSFGGGCTRETGGDLEGGNDCEDLQFAVLMQ